MRGLLKDDTVILTTHRLECLRQCSPHGQYNVDEYDLISLSICISQKLIQYIPVNSGM